MTIRAARLAATGRRPVVLALALTLAATAALASATVAAPKSCASSDLRFPFRTGGPKTFGVFSLTVEGGSCATAHRVAKAWSKALRESTSGRAPKTAAGFRFQTLPATEAQQFRERGRRGTTTIRFAYVVPNG